MGGQCSCETLYKRTNYLSEIFVSLQIQTFYMHAFYQNVPHINKFLFFIKKFLPNDRDWTVKSSFLRYSSNSVDLLVCLKLHHIKFWSQDWWILRIVTLPFLQMGRSPSSMINPADNSPTIIQFGLSNNTPLQNFKEKKGRRPNKSRLKQLKLIMGTRFTFPVCAPPLTYNNKLCLNQVKPRFCNF